MTAINKTSAELLASKALASGMKKELVENILPYWINNMSHASGEGFYGRIDGHVHSPFLWYPASMGNEDSPHRIQQKVHPTPSS